MASLHSFEYDNAMRHSEKVLQHDQTALSLTGGLMSLYHQLLDRPFGERSS